MNRDERREFVRHTIDTGSIFLREGIEAMVEHISERWEQDLREFAPDAEPPEV